jgi:glycine/D-amino acid oxidase-like deaminating enzyme
LDLLSRKYTLNSLNKPISPDGLPIIGNLPNWPNVIVNVGYNSFGIQDYFGGAKIITDYLSNPKSNKKDW